MLGISGACHGRVGPPGCPVARRYSLVSFETHGKRERDSFVRRARVGCPDGAAPSSRFVYDAATAAPMTATRAHRQVGRRPGLAVSTAVATIGKCATMAVDGVRRPTTERVPPVLAERHLLEEEGHIGAVCTLRSRRRGVVTFLHAIPRGRDRPECTSVCTTKRWRSKTDREDDGTGKWYLLIEGRAI